MSNNTAPRIPRDRFSAGQALFVQLGLAFAAWAVLYLVWEYAMRLAGR